MTDREAFEAFISAPPFEFDVYRFDDRGAWPGNYTDIQVDLAWQAWQAATTACSRPLEMHNAGGQRRESAGPQS